MRIKRQNFGRTSVSQQSHCVAGLKNNPAALLESGLGRITERETWLVLGTVRSFRVPLPHAVIEFTLKMASKVPIVFDFEYLIGSKTWVSPR